MPDPIIIHCPVCGVNNRVPLRKMESGLVPVCGKCKSALPIPAGPLVITDANFSGQVESSPLPVLLDMWAPWCGPCRMLAPVVDELAQELSGRVRVAKLNVDENPNTASRFGIRSIPCLLVLNAGRQVDSIIGVQSKGEIIRRLHQAIGL